METKVPEKLDAICGEIRERVLAARALERLILSDDFTEAYGRATDELKLEAKDIIDGNDISALRTWIARSLRGQTIYAEMSLRELRVAAAKLGVPFYSRLPKASLLSEIARYEKSRTTFVANGRCETAYPHRP